MRKLITIIILLFSLNGNSQETIFGLQFKPIIPVNYFNAGPVNLHDSIINLDIVPKFGYSIGMVFRRSFTDWLSLESGINTIRRNYDIFGESSFGPNKQDTADFGFVSYEIPIQALIYIRLSEQIYMNTATGIGVNWYASNVNSLGANNHISHFSWRARWMNLSFLANLGFEYRTKEKGYFYLGASLVNPLSTITVTEVNYYYDNNQYNKLSTQLNGNYVTLDFRYFFAEKGGK